MNPMGQFPTSSWVGYAPGLIQCGRLQADFNSTADQPIQIDVPTATYHIAAIEVSGPSIALSAAVGGIYSAPSKGGVAIVAAGQVYSALTAGPLNTSGSTLLLTLNSIETIRWNLSTLYFSLTTPQGAPANADIRIRCFPLYR